MTLLASLRFLCRALSVQPLPSGGARVRRYPLARPLRPPASENLAMAARRGKPRGLGWALNHKLKRELRDRIRTLNMGLEDRIDNAIGSLPADNGRR